MAKKIMASWLGIKKTKRKRKSSKVGGILRNLIDYLKSDSHMYSPLSSSRSTLLKPLSSNRIVDKEDSFLKKDDSKNLSAKVMEYLKSDDYMYAPLLLYQQSIPSDEIQTSPRLVAEAEADEEVMEGPTTPEKRSMNEAANILQDSNSNPVARTVVRLAKYHTEAAVKHVVQNHCLTPPLTGSVRRTRGSRNVIVE